MAVSLRTFTHYLRCGIAVALLVLTVCGLVGCGDSPRRRPVSVLSLGDYRQFTEPYTYRQDVQLMVFKDANGLSFMSTACTYDLAFLKFGRGESGAPEFSSPFSDSRYGLRGEVLAGPAKFALPRYRARLAEDVLGGPKTFVYVELPEEVSTDWRLKGP